MTKKLKALDKLAKQIELDEDADFWEIKHAHEAVEQALLKTEKLEKENNELKGQVKYLTEVVTDFQKILSTIREKNVDIGFLKWCLAEYDSDMAIFVYNGGQNILPENKLTQQEFDLLKKVL